MKVAMAWCVALTAAAGTAMGGVEAAPATRPAAGPAGELKTPAARISYAFGMDIGAALKGLDTDIDTPAFIRGILDAAAGKALLTPEQAEEIKDEFVQRRQSEEAAKVKALGEKNKQAGEAYLAANQKKPGVTVTASGLQYEVLKAGAGATPKVTDQVKVHYRGTLIDGKEFDSTAKMTAPVEIPLSNVIPGFREGVLLMKVGGKSRFCVPAALAYGERGAGRDIGPFAVLIFEVELFGVEAGRPADLFGPETP
jgi:FKBP-type peptidyl-prolyl cis-trans isomerase